MKQLTKIFLSIFYVGNIKFAPGTWGSILALFIMFLFIEILSFSLLTLIIIFIFLLIISNILINYYSSLTKSHDSDYIVVDELLGIFFIFLFYDIILIVNDFYTYLLIFIFFRFLDIIKIFPANYIDKKLKNGYGVILDDIVAGLYTILTLLTLNAFI